MPFTFVHPGYLLWLKRRWQNISISAIVISSIVPDFDILFRITDTRIHIFNYSFKDVFLIILPIAFILWIVYEYLIKKIFVSVFPMMNSKNYSLNDYPIIILLMIFSVYLHIFLDMISHWNANTFQMIVGCNSGNIILSFIAYYFSLYGVGIIFSGIGLYLIIKYIYQIYNINIFKINKIKLYTQQKIYVLIYIIVALLFFILKFYLAIKEVKYFIDIFIINFTASLIFSFFITPILYSLFYKPSVSETNC